MATKKQLREFQDLIEELGERLGTLAEDAGEDWLEESGDRLEAMKERLGEVLNRAKTKGRQTLKKVKEASQAADEFAHENPWKVAASAALIGGLVGFLVASKKRD